MRLLPHSVTVIRQAYVCRHEPECARILAHVFWKGLLTITPVTLLCVIGFSWWSITILRAAEGVNLPAGGSDRSLKKEIEGILIGQQERAEHHNSLIQQPLRISDPYSAKPAQKTQSQMGGGIIVR